MTINCQQKNNSDTIIGERVKQLRKARKLSQTEFAKKLEVTQGFIAHIENGRNQPTVELLARMAVIFDCSFTWLATGKGDMEAGADIICQQSGNVIIAEAKTKTEYSSEPGKIPAAAEQFPFKYYSETAKKIIRALPHLNEEDTESVLKYIEERRVLAEYIKERANKAE